MKYIKRVLKSWLPPALLSAVRRLGAGGVNFEGNYESWDAAAPRCTGYDADSILEKVLSATLKVKQGVAVFERDSVIFDKVEYSWPVTAALMWAAAKNGGVLHVLDFGGSLGSGYFQNRKFLENLKLVSWSVIEQKKFVITGNEKISDDILKFYFDIDSYLKFQTPNIVLVSSVLQYLEKPFDVLSNLAKSEVETIVIDRTPFINNSKCDLIKVQRVPKKIYSASYPCRFFNMDALTNHMQSMNYEIVECFESLDKLSNEANWQGIIFKKTL
jgi:putative methyltransferase (TIGR04325 family)